MPLGLWFAYAMLGLVGTNEVAVLSFLSKPLNAILMAAFVVTLFYHMVLGLHDIVDDYVHTAGMKVFLRIAILAFTIATGAVSLFALIRIAAST